VWPAALGKVGNNTPRSSAVCLTLVGGAYPGNRRAQSCPKMGHVANKWSSSSGVLGQKGHSPGRRGHRGGGERLECVFDYVEGSRRTPWPSLAQSNPSSSLRVVEPRSAPEGWRRDRRHQPWWSGVPIASVRQGAVVGTQLQEHRRGGRVQRWPLS
jgi:hypothetical protein